MTSLVHWRDSRRIPVVPGAVDGRRRLVTALALTARPKQWLKNVLVFSAPGAAGVLTQPGKLGAAVIAFAVLCAAASGTYFFNDARDAAGDREHPVKRYRPVAAGTVPVAFAYCGGVVLAAGSVAVALIALNTATAVIVASYLVLTTSYSCGLKRVPVLDIGMVAVGFVLRAVAGAAAAGVPVSRWYLLVVAFSATFMVVGKRLAEHRDLGADAGKHRVVLSGYTGGFLQQVQTLSAAVAVVAYCLWALGFGDAASGAASAQGTIWYQLSIAPFVLGLFRYSLRVSHGHGGAPEELILRDRFLLLTGLVWAVLFVGGVYLD